MRKRRFPGDVYSSKETDDEINKYEDPVDHNLLIPSSKKSVKKPRIFESIHRTGDVSEIANVTDDEHVRSSLLPRCSEEQEEVIRILKIDHKNVWVRGCAGGGKTTLLMQIAAAHPKQPVLAMTFSASLKDEMRSKKEILQLKNLEPHNFHSFGVQYYSEPEACTDMGIIRLLEEDRKPTSYCTFSIFQLDEAQDVTPLLYRWIVKIIRDHYFRPTNGSTGSNSVGLETALIQRNGHEANNNQKTLQLCIVGDKNQNIYSYKGSDARYLTMAARVFSALSNRPWKQVVLRRSYRLTRPIAAFVNWHVFRSRSGDPNQRQRYSILSDKPGPPVEYYRGCIQTQGVMMLDYLFKKHDLVSGNVFVFAPSTRKDTISAKLHNQLVSDGRVTFICSSSEATSRTDRLMSNKVSFLTHHRGKGLERETVIILQFDDSMMWAYPESCGGQEEEEEQDTGVSFNSESKTEEERNTHRCPPPLFVALTRGSHRLILIHDHGFSPLPFLDMNEISIHDFPFGQNSVAFDEDAEDEENQGEDNNSTLSCTCIIPDSTTEQHTMEERKPATILGNNVATEDRPSSATTTTTSTSTIRPLIDMENEHDARPAKRINVSDLLSHRSAEQLHPLIATNLKINDLSTSFRESLEPSTAGMTVRTTTTTTGGTMSTQPKKTHVLFADKELDVTTVVDTGHETIEDVQSINEFMPVIILEYHTNKSCALLEQLFTCYRQNRLHEVLVQDRRVQSLFARFRSYKTAGLVLSTSDMLFIACVWDAHTSGHLNRFARIREFSWFNQDDFNFICRKLLQALDFTSRFLHTVTMGAGNHFQQGKPVANMRFHVPVSCEIRHRNRQYQISTVIDVWDMDHKVMYMISYSQEFGLHAQMQMLCLMYILRMETQLVKNCKDYKFIYVNVASNSIHQVSLRSDDDNASVAHSNETSALRGNEFFHNLLEMKRGSLKKHTDSEFVSECLRHCEFIIKK